MNRSALSVWLVAALAFFSANARAVILDWDAVSWAAGSLSNSYDIDPSSPGNDISVAVTGNTSQLGPKGGSQTPAILNIIEGGLSPVQNILALQLDLANQSQFVTVTMNFSANYTAGVAGVSFTLFD